MSLDEFQLPFCQDPQRGLRLLAPAGSGKTHALLYRCLHQWESAKTPKPRFLLFTFTKAARDELRDRLRSSPDLQPVAGSVDVQTLNAWGFRRLKSRSHNLKIIASSQEIFFAVNNQLQPVWKKYPTINALMTSTRSRNKAAKTIMNLIDGFKSLGFRHDVHAALPAYQEHTKWLRDAGLSAYFTKTLMDALTGLQIIAQGTGDPSKQLEAFLTFWSEATVQLKGMDMITLEDQKYWAWLDLEKDLEEGKFTTGMHRYDHVLVDEFQDVNCLDLCLLQAIAKVNKTELTIVGDDDQAIYEWRGASPSFILNPDTYVGQDVTTYILNRNYRSPRNIVEIAQRLIRNNQRRVDKQIEAANQSDARIEVLRAPNLADSINYVVAEVRRMLDAGDITKVAIIGRKRSQIIPYQIVFASHDIPFYAAEDLQVFLSEAFSQLKDILGIKARAGSGPIPGIDPIQELMKLVDKVKRYPLSKADREGLVRHLQVNRPRTLPLALAELRQYRGAIKGSNQDGSIANDFADAILALLCAGTVADALRAISFHFEGLQKDYGKATEDIFYTDPPFLFLSEFAERYGTDYNLFYEDLEKAIATLARVPRDEDDNDSAPSTPEWKLPLHLMTALRAKGKEFDAVILLDVNEDIWPSKLATTAAELESERRVFYVAITRARKRLTLLVNQSILGKSANPSPYLAEMGLPITPLP